MYTELIEKLNPKPKFNLNWYKEKDLYSEGDIEDLMIKLIAENEPENYCVPIGQNFNWSVYYHLTHVRKNILNWYPFEKDSEVLEIGCGLGAITNMLCERCANVTAVELSKRRATATLLRCRERENLEIIVGNLNDIKFDKKFDYITLIGVLEYQGTYTNTDNPYIDFLKEIKKLLKPNGKLLIAIENKYGIKYWCGAREDHTGIPFDGINQYAVSKRAVQTFSKAELEDLVKQSGFRQTYFYYPMPDYKLPTVIYSEKYLPNNENMERMEPYYAPDKKTLIADENAIYKDIINNNVFEFFANSFLVECADVGEVGKITFAKISSNRQMKYCIGTRFTNENRVEKFSLTAEDDDKHIMQILKNQQALEKFGRNVWKADFEEGKIVSDFTDKELLEDRLHSLYRKKNVSEIFRIYDCVLDEIVESSEHAKDEENILYSLGIADKNVHKEYGPILKIGYIDMIFRNAFCEGEEIYWFDQEWILELIPAKFVFYRAIQELYNSFLWMNDVISIPEIIERYFGAEVWNEYSNLERLFSEAVIDHLHMGESKMFCGVDQNVCVSNIQKILN